MKNLLVELLLFTRRIFIRFFKNKNKYFIPVKSLNPISDKFGFDRGKPIDRFWIELFLEKNKQYIKGHVLEITDNKYTKKFGRYNVRKSDILDIDINNKKANIHGDLRNLPRIKTDTYDTIVLTHVLGLIDNLDSAISECHRILKPGGALLITSSCFSPQYKGDHAFWRFTKYGLYYLLNKCFPANNIKTDSYGNVLAGQCFWAGFAQEDLSKEQLLYNDERFPCIVSAVAIKEKGKHPSYSIGIPVYNEARNIKILLNTIFSLKNFDKYIDKVILYNDASTDSSLKEISKIKNSKIEIIDKRKRRGVGFAQNEIFKICKSDYLILLHADIRISDLSFIQEIISTTAFSNIDLLAGKINEITPLTIFEKILYAGMHLKHDIFENFNNGSNIFTCHGPIRIFSKKVYKKLRFNTDFAEDMYSYLFCKNNGLNYQYNPRVKVDYRLPMSYSDHYLQTKRFYSSKRLLPEFDIPIKYYILPVFLNLIRFKFLFAAYLLLLIKIRIALFFDRKPIDINQWKQVKSTKIIDFNHD